MAELFRRFEVAASRALGNVWALIVKDELLRAVEGARTGLINPSLGASPLAL